MWLGEGEVEQARDVGGFGAEFRRIIAGVDLEQHRKFAAELTGGPVEGVEQLLAVDALNAFEMGDGQPRLVRLQMPDEFPAHGGGGQDAFSRGFLHAVFADGTEAETSDVFHGGGRVGLGYR